MRIAPTTQQSSVMTLVAAAIVISALYVGRSVLIPIALAVLLAFMLTPLVRAIRKLGVPSSAAVLLVVATLLGVLVAAGFVVSHQGKLLAENIPRYEYSLREKLKTLRGAVMQSKAVEKAAETIRDLGKELSKPKEGPESGKDSPFSSPKPSAETKLSPVPVTIQKPPSTVLDDYRQIIGTLMAPMTVAGLVFLYLTFILLQRQDLRDRMIRLAGVHDIERTTTTMAEAGDRLSRFFLLQLGINVTYGVFVGLALWFIGVPNPVLWAGLAFLMRYVPYVGSVLAAAFPLILAAAVDPTWTTFLWTLALYVIGEAVMGQVVEPMAFGNNTGLSPFAVVVSATLWTSLWGPVGLVLAIPLTLLIVTMSRHIQQLYFLTVMFGDEPALGPAERFYQRSLSNDAQEAVEICEQHIKQDSLVNCYDEIGLGALRLAQSDADRGALDNDKLSIIAEVVAEVVDDLDFVENASATPGAPTKKLINKSTSGDQLSESKPSAGAIPVLNTDDLLPAWRTETPLLCISGRSPLDAAAADMTLHLLQSHGINCALLPYREMTSVRAANADTSEVTAVILSYVSTGKHTAHVRSLIRRLRRNMPDAIVIAGLWGNVDDEGTIMQAPEIGADHTVSTMKQALQLCVSLAKGEIGAVRSSEAAK